VAREESQKSSSFSFSLSLSLSLWLIFPATPLFAIVSYISLFYWVEDLVG
jgi:hypothetical protein